MSYRRKKLILVLAVTLIMTGIISLWISTDESRPREENTNQSALLLETFREKAREFQSLWRTP